MTFLLTYLLMTNLFNFIHFRSQMVKKAVNESQLKLKKGVHTK